MEYNRWPVKFLLVFTASVVALAVHAEESDEFKLRVAPIFERHCLRCHNDSTAKASLSLESAARFAKGGDSGETITAGDAGASLLIDMITGEKPEMPKNAPPLRAEEIEVIRNWINDGAKWPSDLRLRDRSDLDTNWWSLLPIVRPPVPTLEGDRAQRVRTPVDAFILAKLDEVGLTPSAEADRRVLIRRLYFDLIGLPPAPGDVDSFVADPDPVAYERLVDRLLSSPGYGERWARHWLDVVHYGDTHGYDKDKLRPNAWPYRDYVVRSFNDGKEYKQFIQEQLAGDVLWPDTKEGIIATGFIAAGPWDFIGHAEVPESKIDGKVARHLDRDDMVSTAMNTFVSVTVQCAQCHHHKFDPVRQEHYYSLQAVFGALDRADRSYDEHPETARRRRAWHKEKDRLTFERDELVNAVEKVAGPELATVDDQLAEIRKQQKIMQDNPAYGYHSQIMPTAEHTKWVQIDLGATKEIAKIVYVGCWDSFNNIFHGFGFPPRFKIEISNEPTFADSNELLVDNTRVDVANPGTKPQTVSVNNHSGRYVRFTATKLAKRQDDYHFALAKLMVFDRHGANLARGKEVTAMDSIEAKPRWSTSNLVDGQSYELNAEPPRAAQLAALQAKRDELLARATDNSTRDRLAQIKAELESVEAQIRSLPEPGQVYCGCIYTGNGSFVGTGKAGGKSREIRILQRGNIQSPGELVGPGALPVIPKVNWQFDLSEDYSEGAARVALAQWITHRDNPLTWRSIVNRIWQYHFGRGLVDTPNDFGRMGQQPTHPELLDWLAAEFRDHGQSVKELHRLIVCSATYRQVSTEAVEDAGATEPSAVRRPTRRSSVDAENRFLWRMNRRKLEAESIRDAVLQVAGKLDRKMFGPAFQDFVIERPEHSPHYEYHKHNPDDPLTHRRSIYRFLVRSQPQPFMNTLDCADPSQRVDKRNETLTALQALSLLNNRFMTRMSEHFARRLETEYDTTDGQIDASYRLTLNRAPTDEERRELNAFVQQFGLPNACRLILNLNEFAFVD